MPSPFDTDNAARRRALHEERNGRCLPLELAPGTISDLNAKIRSAVAEQLSWNGKCSACNRNPATHGYLFIFRIIESEPRQHVVFRLSSETMLSWKMSKSDYVFVQRETVEREHLIEIVPADFVPPLDQRLNQIFLRF